VSKSFIEAIAYRLGRKAAQAKSAFDLFGGTDEDSLRAEIRLGRDLAAGLLERIPLVQDNETTRFAVQITGWLAGSVKEKKLPFRVHVTGEREPNAIALPGGPIFVSWPLLEMCQGDRDSIAFIVGHEMGHIVLRHSLDKIVKDSAVSLLLRHTSTGRAANAWLEKAGKQVLSTAYGRDEELEADVFAASLVRRTGGDALAAERLLESLAQRCSEQSVAKSGNYFAAHPPFSERVANLCSRRHC